MDSSLVQYLEDILRRARRGEIVCFVGSAAAVEAIDPEAADGTYRREVRTTTSVRYELKTLVGVALPPDRVARLQEDDLRKVYAQCLEGLARGTQALSSGVADEVARRDPLSTRKPLDPGDTRH